MVLLLELYCSQCRINLIFDISYECDCKEVGHVCNVRLLPIALGPSFLDKGVRIGPT